MLYKPDINYYFFEFAPFKSFLNENEQFSNLGNFVVVDNKCHIVKMTGIREVKVYFFLVGGCARHLQNPATKCDLPIG
jgi:hypothetical protein